jgi:hypothetical protein
MAKADGWAAQDVDSPSCDAPINQQVVCSTQPVAEATSEAKQFYNPLHALLQPPDCILRLVFPEVLDVSHDAAAPRVLDIVDAIQHLNDNEVQPQAYDLI